MEEEPEDSQRNRTAPGNRRIQACPPNEKIAQWLSPRSDHFPTPRGFHFLSAPILPESPSTASIDESNSPSTATSNPWNRTSVSTDVTEFDDIYDVSGEEDTRRKPTRTSSLRRRSSSGVTMPKRLAVESPASHRALPPLVIPGQRDQNAEAWSGRPDFKKLMSPVPPTPPAKVEMSPAVISFLQSQQYHEVPTMSAPPSLDGSLSSEQLAAMSAPPTPVIGADDHAHGTGWSGVQLQPAALATLQALSRGEDIEEDYQPEQVIEYQGGRLPEMSQQTPRLFSSTSRPALRLATEPHQQSLHGLTRLDIPSPGGFFSGLTPRTRHTWHLPSMTPEDVAPPTSTTAEQFYRCPWNEAAPPVPSLPNLPPPPPRPTHFLNISSPQAPVEQVVEIRGTMSDGIPTARPVILEQVVEARPGLPEGPPTAIRIERNDAPTSPAIQGEPTSPTEGIVATEIVTDHDPGYTKKQQEAALSNLDRTELWLMAQKAYLAPIELQDDVQSEPESEAETVEIHIEEDPKAKEPEDLSTPQKKKTVRFSEIAIRKDIPRSLPSKLMRQESAYYRAFQDYIIRSRTQDTFVHRLPRFEALQAQRISLREAHRNQLLGKHQLSVVPQSARKRMSANVVRGDDVLVDDPEKLKREKEHEALNQMSMANWHVSATKALNGGRLFSAPIAKRLARLSRIGGANDRARILDLGGQAACDWAWHCAIMYPNTKVYTVTTKAIRQLSNSNVRGPPNHRQVAVDWLTRLPFPDAHFDLVSARELHSVLKFIGENGEDEWEGCLSEVMRVLKPGGYLEFSLLDSDVVNAGPLGLAKSVEFGFALKTLGYDPNPTRLFLGRLGRAGFEGVRRAWMCLPMGGNEEKRNVSRDSAGVERSLELEAMVQGSTAAAASVTGLAGGWSWERWLLRCEMEKVACEDRSLNMFEPADMREAGKCLEGVHDVVEEGRRCGAGWRVLNGFARKPKSS
ncbi:Uu.00g014310.m01.CDS01 [Anthostomella pinea]|uniref:Uu.00g014310.m01.CDS01 n=1 Tax=Anthostomella pinea TaxID=933095 RepID=A0AAI8VYB6_9PEZI|nr:Uu.00g014310.m01.CDS01 [Anthostomella pinea]